MAELDFKSGAEHEGANATDSFAQAKKLHEKGGFKLEDFWKQNLDAAEKQRENSLKNFLPRLVVDKADASQKSSLTSASRPKTLEKEEDHSTEKNAPRLNEEVGKSDLLDDVKKIIHSADKGQIKVDKDSKPSLVPDKPSDKNLPVVYSPDVATGQLGLLAIKEKNGSIRYTPFIGGEKDPNKTYAPGSVDINSAAAKELGIEKEIKRGTAPKVDVIPLPVVIPSGGVQPRNPEDLHQNVKNKVHDVAEQFRALEVAENEKKEATLKDPPKPDAEFGYRRTTRDPVELRQIAENYRNIAKTAMDSTDPAVIKDRMKAFGQQAQKDIQKYSDEIDENSVAAKKAKTESASLEKQIADRQKHKKETESLAPKLADAKAREAAANSSLEIAKYNKSYAEYELRLSKDEKIFARHMQSKASAAAALSMNPDVQGALNGRKVVVNSGHWAGDPQFPGFEFDGTAEWKMNLDSQDVYGEMLKMTGAAVKVVNQADLPRKERGMTGLAAAIKAAKPEVAIAIHHDDAEVRDAPSMNGTLTLHCAPDTGDESLELATAIHKAKVNVGGLDDRYNPKGESVGIREQCGRGIQGHDVGAPFILDEQFSTHKEQWPKARSPKWNAAEQFSKVVGVIEFLNKAPVYKTDPATGKEWQSKVWSQTNMDYVWNNRKIGGW